MKQVVSIFKVALFLFATLLWLAMVAIVATINQSDAAGQGMSYGFAFILAIMLWISIAVLMVLAMSRPGIAGWVKIAAIVLLPLSFAAALAAINVLHGRGAESSGWPIIVPSIVPLLLLGYAVWTMVPTLRDKFSAALMDRTVWGLVLVLSLVPWPLLRAKNRRDAEMQAAYEVKAKAADDSAAQTLESGFDSLTPETPLRDWLAFATAGNDMRERTLAGIRTLPDRQAEAEALKGDDVAMMMYELRNLGLEATPALCRSANDFLMSHAESFRSKAPTTERYEIEGAAIEKYLFAMQWLAGNGCNIDRSIDRYEAVVKLFPVAADREQFLARLASLRRARR